MPWTRSQPRALEHAKKMLEEKHRAIAEKDRVFAEILAKNAELVRLVADLQGGKQGL